MNQKNIPNSSINESFEGRSIRHSFIKGSSGPFGRDIPQPWVSYEKVIEQSDKYWAMNEGRELFGWFDLHASLSVLHE